MPTRNDPAQFTMKRAEREALAAIATVGLEIAEGWGLLKAPETAERGLRELAAGRASMPRLEALALARIAEKSLAVARRVPAIGALADLEAAAAGLEALKAAL